MVELGEVVDGFFEFIEERRVSRESTFARRVVSLEGGKGVRVFDNVSIVRDESRLSEKVRDEVRWEGREGEVSHLGVGGEWYGKVVKEVVCGCTMSSNE